MIELITASIQLLTSVFEFASTVLTVRKAENTGDNLTIITYKVLYQDNKPNRVVTTKQDSINPIFAIIGWLFLSWIYFKFGDILLAFITLINTALFVQTFILKQNGYLIGRFNYIVSSVIVLPTIHAIIVYIYKSVFQLHDYVEKYSQVANFEDYIASIANNVYWSREVIYLLLTADMAFFYIIYIVYAISLFSFCSNIINDTYPTTPPKILLADNLFKSYIPSFVICAVIYLQLKLKFVQ